MEQKSIFPYILSFTIILDKFDKQLFHTQASLPFMLYLQNVLLRLHK